MKMGTGTRGDCPPSVPNSPWPLWQREVGGIFQESVTAESRKTFSHASSDWACRTPLLTLPPFRKGGHGGI